MRAAIAEGVTRQSLEIQIPLVGASGAQRMRPPPPTKQAQQAACLVSLFLAPLVLVSLSTPTLAAHPELDDWPGGVPQQWKALEPLAESLLRGSAASAAGVLQRKVDEVDAVTLLSCDTLDALCFATADTFSEVVGPLPASAVAPFLAPRA